jgi:hypothetical protein
VGSAVQAILDSGWTAAAATIGWLALVAALVVRANGQDRR